MIDPHLLLGLSIDERDVARVHHIFPRCPVVCKGRDVGYVL